MNQFFPFFAQLEESDCKGIQSQGSRVLKEFGSKATTFMGPNCPFSMSSGDEKVHYIGTTKPLWPKSISASSYDP